MKIDIIVQNIVYFTEKNKYLIPSNLQKGVERAEERKQKC